MPVKLTAKAVENAELRATRYEIADAIQPGLHLVVQPSGAKSWAYRYERTDEKRTRVKITLGRASGPGALTLQAARNAANDARRLRSAGQDPADQRQAEKQALAARIATEAQEARRKADTVESVLPRYLADHADALKSGDEVRRVLTKELAPWAKRRVDDIQRRDAISLLDAVKARAPIQSNRLRSYARHFFAWCLRQELVAANPFLGTVGVREKERSRVLSDDELRLLLLGISRLEWPRRQFVHLLLLTAQRLNEVAEMEWSELSLTADPPSWKLPDARSKNGAAHIVPLSPPAVEILTSMDRMADSSRVFASFSEAHAKARIDAVMLQVAREEAEARGDDPEAVAIEPWRFHDLRRTAATKMPDLGVDILMVERVLNHQLRGSMKPYQLNQFIPEKRRALALWASHLASLAAPPQSNVIPLVVG